MDPKPALCPVHTIRHPAPGYTILDVDANAMLFVGGLAGETEGNVFLPIHLYRANSWHDDFGQRQDTKLQKLDSFLPNLFL